MDDDIFLSYAREDQDKAEALAHLLRRHSWSIFWDRTIPPGKTWDELIEKALSNAKVVIVLWSPSSVESAWVRAEAEEAAHRGVLVPVMIDEVRPPLRFRHIQAVDLTRWNCTTVTRDIDALLDAIKALINERLAPDQQVPVALCADEDGLGQEFRGIARQGKIGGTRAVVRALGFHLLLGFGLFYVDCRLKRRWLYVAFPLYALIDAILGPGLAIDPFAGDFGQATFYLALALYLLSFVDVAITGRRHFCKSV